MYSIDDLRTFVAIAEAHGVTAGAKRVGISAATASHRLAKLETALKVLLFHRSSRMLRLTDEGEVFFERVQRILGDLAQAELDAGGGAIELTGQIRATMAPWILSRFILPRLPAFQSRHSGLTFDFLSVDRFVSLPAEGQDCAVRVGRLEDSALIARKLCDNERIICASPSFLERHGAPNGAQEILDLPWTCLPWQTRIALRDAKGRRRDASVRADIRVSNSDMLTDAVVRGLGLAVKSRLAVKPELESGALIEVSPGGLWEPEAPIWFVYPREAQSTRKTKLFGAFLTECFDAIE